MFLIDDMSFFVIVALVFLFFSSRLKFEASITRKGPRNSGVIKKSQLAMLDHGKLRVESSERLTLLAQGRGLRV